jgi:hypothetical protein
MPSGSSWYVCFPSPQVFLAPAQMSKRCPNALKYIAGSGASAVGDRFFHLIKISPNRQSIRTPEKLEDPVIPHNYHRPDPVSGPDFPAVLAAGDSLKFWILRYFFNYNKRKEPNRKPCLSMIHGLGTSTRSADALDSGVRMCLNTCEWILGTLRIDLTLIADAQREICPILPLERVVIVSDGN